MSKLKSYSVTIAFITALFGIISLGPAAIGTTIILTALFGLFIGVTE